MKGGNQKRRASNASAACRSASGVSRETGESCRKGLIFSQCGGISTLSMISRQISRVQRMQSWLTPLAPSTCFAPIGLDLCNYCMCHFLALIQRSVLRGHNCKTVTNCGGGAVTFIALPQLGRPSLASRASRLR